jgi:hypothetical protein
VRPDSAAAHILHTAYFEIKPTVLRTVPLCIPVGLRQSAELDDLGAGARGVEVDGSVGATGGGRAECHSPETHHVAAGRVAFTGAPCGPDRRRGRWASGRPASVSQVKGGRTDDGQDLAAAGAAARSDQRGAWGEAAVGQAGAQLDARGAGPSDDPDAIDRLDTDLDGMRSCPSDLCAKFCIKPRSTFAARTRAGTRPTLKSGEAD